MSEEHPASFAAVDSNFSDRDDIIDFERSPSPMLLIISPKVTFDVSSLSSRKRPETEDCTDPLGGSSASERITPMATLTNTCFTPLRLILTSHDQTRNVEIPALSFDLPSESSKNPNPATRPRAVTFDPSSLSQAQENLSSSDDELQLAPTENTENVDSLDQRVVNSNLSLDNEFQAVEQGSKGQSNGGLRSILKLKKPFSSIEKIVAGCLKLLCKTGDKHHVRDLIHSNSTKVFKGLCFDQFFRKGECFSTICDDNHHYKSHIFSHSKEELWNASLYVICHAVIPHCRIIENLVQHYTAKGNTIRALLFTKCIAKVKEADRLELAHFIINKLSGTMPMRDVITVILMLNFSELSYMRYNILMEGLRVFEQNTTDYSELMTFLNFHRHQMPARFIVKLMKDSMKYSGKDMVELISGFLRRLHPSQKDDVQPIANIFIERFGDLPDTVDYEHPGKRSNIQTKKVNFAPDVCEFRPTDSPSDMQDEVDPSEADFSSEDMADDAQPNIPNFYGSPDLQAERIGQVFGESCVTWMLNGQCSDPVCSLIHDFNKNSLAGLSSEDVYVAADFIIARPVTPSIKILKIFIEFLAESNEVAKVLKFRHCTPKLSNRESLKLTKLVISLLGKQIGRWGAIEKVLVPNIVALDDLDQQFSFDEELLCHIMSEAIETKTTVMRCVSKVILELITKLPLHDSTEKVHLASSYIQKFVFTGREPSPCLDIPWRRIAPNSFASYLKVALYQGVPSKYFLATIMMKQAIDGSLRDQALDVLYTFLLCNFDRARVLTHLLENCNYFNGKTKRSVAEIFGTVGLNTGIWLYDNENFAGTAELLDVLKKFKLNIFELPASRGNTTELNLAIIYCSVTVDTVHRNDTIDIFFNRVLDPYLESASSECPPELMKLTAKMFRVFTTALLVEESIKLYKGIIVRQKSLVSPLNIVQFVEPTLRCAFHRSLDGNISKECLRLYFDAVDCGTPITFQKVTHRSVFMITLMEITRGSLKDNVKGHIDILNPLMKKMLIRCIKEGAYHDIKTRHISIYSSMTADEMKVYVMWWFALYVRGRERGAIDYFSPVTVNITQDFIQDDSRLPVHHSLQSVNVSITDCAERLTSVIKNIIDEPVLMIPSRDRGVIELHPATVRALSQTAFNLMLQHGYIKTEADRLCTFRFDKLKIELGNL